MTIHILHHYISAVEKCQKSHFGDMQHVEQMSLWCSRDMYICLYMFKASSELVFWGFFRDFFFGHFCIFKFSSLNKCVFDFPNMRHISHTLLLVHVLEFWRFFGPSTKSFRYFFTRIGAKWRAMKCATFPPIRVQKYQTLFMLGQKKSN